MTHIDALNIVRARDLAASPSSPITSRKEASKNLADGESCRTIAKTYGVHHATIARLAG
jgi:transposase